jgi:hypothetical protein
MVPVCDDPSMGAAASIGPIGPDTVASLVSRLESVVADLDDLAFDRLREASAGGATVRPAGDKQLMQARRSIDKAIAILASIDRAAHDPSDRADPSGHDG